MRNTRTSTFITASGLLLTLVMMESSNVMLTRYIRYQNNAEELFKIGDMMFVTELCKIMLATLLEFRSSGGQLIQSLHQHNPFTRNNRSLSLPALLYLIQNSLFYIALTNLTAPMFQILYQLKLLTTAIVSVLLLQRVYSTSQWISLSTLTIGSMIALSDMLDNSNAQIIISDTYIGILSVFIACFCSAFASVWVEKLLKKDSTSQADNKGTTVSSSTSTSTSTSLWMRNIQLGTYSLLFATVSLLFSSWADNKQEGNAPTPFLFGFTTLVWILVFLRASSGILVAVIIVYLDNVIRSITSCVSVLVGCIVSMFLFGDNLRVPFWIGAVIVVVSSYTFSQQPTHMLSFVRSGILSFVWRRSIWRLTVLFLFLPFVLNMVHLGYLTSTLSIPTMLSIPLFSSVPEDYFRHLHFIVYTTSKYNPKGDCGGCKVLWELYHTLLAYNYSASNSFTNIPSNRSVVVITPEGITKTWNVSYIHVRWILAPIGVMSIPKKWNPTDLVFNYATSTAKNISSSNVLQVVTTPAKGDQTDISDEQFYSKNRTGIAWMMRKGQSHHSSITPIHNRTGYVSTQVDKRVTVSDLRKFEYFVTYDPYTYWTWFAAMMGTVPIVYPIANVSKEEWALGTFIGAFMQDQNIEELPGVAYGWDDSEIDYARRTMHELRPLLLRLRKWGADVTVARFTRDCYRYSQGERENFEAAKLVQDLFPR